MSPICHILLDRGRLLCFNGGMEARGTGEGRLVYRDGSREVWETVRDGRSIFLAVTPLGTFICDLPDNLVLSERGLLELALKGGSDATESYTSEG